MKTLKMLGASLACTGALIAPITMAAPASAATYSMTTSDAVNLRSMPGTGSSIAGTVAPGGTVDITCYVQGEELTAGGWTSTRWDRTRTGAYVWDGFVKTPTTAPVVPRCKDDKAAVDQFAVAKVGQFVDTDGYPTSNPYQCWDLVDYFGWKYTPADGVWTGDGRAAGAFENFGNMSYNDGGRREGMNSDHFTRTTYSAGKVPKPGDIIVWKGTAENGYAGHIAVVVRATSTSVTVVEQNAPVGSPAHISTYSSYRNVLGWLSAKEWV